MSAQPVQKGKLEKLLSYLYFLLPVAIIPLFAVFGDMMFSYLGSALGVSYGQAAGATSMASQYLNSTGYSGAAKILSALSGQYVYNALQMPNVYGLWGLAVGATVGFIVSVVWVHDHMKTENS